MWPSFAKLLSDQGVSAIIGCIVTVFFQQIWRGLRYAFFEINGLRKIWGFSSNQTYIFVPMSAGQGVGPVSALGDIQAMSEFVNLVRRLHGNTSQLSVHRSQDHEIAQYLHDNLVIIGGGKYNAAYLRLIEALDVPCHFFDTPQKSNDALKDRNGNVVAVPTLSDRGEVLVDVALVVTAPNPFNTSKRVVIVAGSHSFGSAGAMTYLCSNRGALDFGLSRGRRKLAIISTRVMGERISSPERTSKFFRW